MWFGGGGGPYRDIVADRIPDQSADARIHKVFHEDVLCVLGTDSAGLEEREAALHEKDEEAAEHQPQDVAGLAVEVDSISFLGDELTDGRVGCHACERARGQRQPDSPPLLCLRAFCKIARDFGYFGERQYRASSFGRKERAAAVLQVAATLRVPDESSNSRGWLELP